MNAASPMRLLTPEILAGLANLELVARSAVEGFLIGLHRSPRFGFSQEFKEYRAYVEGDDPRFVDWNVFARTERTYIRRYEGETNTRLFVLLDASASMGFSSGKISKLQYGKYLAASLAYLATQQHDAVGLLVFDNAIRQYRPPSSRVGSLHGVLHALDTAMPGGATDLAGCFQSLREHLTRRGLVVVISDLYCDPQQLTRAIQPLAYRGHDIMIFQVLDREELKPSWKESVVFEDMESGEQREVSSDYLHGRYKDRLEEHLSALRKAAANVGAHQLLVDTSEPLDQALRRYLLFRQKQL